MNIIHSARISENSEVFSDILSLYAQPGSTILDMTFGRGMFWKKVHRTDIKRITCDIAFGQPDFRCDFQNVPLPDSTIDLVVLDPPYAVTKSKTHSRGKCSEEFAYGLAGGTESQTKHSDKENVQLYLSGAKEAFRLLRNKGFLILKTQDNAKYFKHLELMKINGFECEDLFIVINPRPPVWDTRWKQQHHARKNHSYFIVHKKTGKQF